MTTPTLNLSDCLAGKCDEALNVAVCEWRGWHVFNGYLNIPTGGTKHGRYDLGAGEHSIQEWLDKSHCSQLDAELPNHITGIGALGHMHETKKRLTKEQRIQFMSALCTIRGVPYPVGFGDIFNLCFESDARQCAIALLQTVQPEIFE